MKAKKPAITEKLPTYTAPVYLWHKIEEQLDSLENTQSDKKLADKLPTYISPDVFENVSPTTKTRIFYRNSARIAASIIIILGFSFGYKLLQNRTKTQITYSVEVETNSNAEEGFALNTYDSDFNTVLNQKCRTNPGVCNQKEFDDLYTQLKDVEKEEKVLKEAFKQYKSPNIESLIIRVTNDKIKLENYILNLFS